MERFDFFSFMFGPAQRSKRDIRMNRCEQELAQGIGGDRQSLEKKLDYWGDKVFVQGSASTIATYARGCLYVGRLEGALEAYGQLSGLTVEQFAVAGLVFYHWGKVEKAFEYLDMTHRNLKDKSIPPAQLALSSLRVRQGVTHPAVHKEILASILESSADANLVLGIAYSNERRHKEAQACFSRADSLDLERRNITERLMAQTKEAERRCVATVFEFPPYKVEVGEIYKIVD